MSNIRDMMRSFELFQPTELEGALTLLREYGSDAWVLSGGMDTFDWLKDRAKQPRVVVDLGGLEELRGISEGDDGGLLIGARTTITEVATHPEVIRRYRLLAEAADMVATPQIRNQGTLGGNLAQDTRCWYYRSGWPCYRAGGNTCYANTPTSINREHGIFEADRCVAVSPSDTAPALVALDARMVVSSHRSERIVDAADFFITPGTDITRMTVLHPGEILVAVQIPERWAGKTFYFEKVADRQAWDFALASVASALELSGGLIQDARIVMGGVSPRPLRMRRVEETIVGRALDDETIEAAGAVAADGARPLRFNQYKLSLTRNLVKRAIREATA
ncbi:MAG: xanthine dehydrogenase family protein subunit M [Gemmatimonas sp.]|nr:xanthine dehydrogenase family protein subunit M [Gemmatimonas sp.]